MGGVTPSGVATGFLGGLSGLTGPPYIVLVSLFSVPKCLARPLFPEGGLLEVPARLALFVGLQGVSEIVRNLHLIVLTLLLGSLGLNIGARVAPLISQRGFESALLLILLLTSVCTLGLLEQSMQSMLSILLTGTLLACRVCYSQKLRQHARV